MHASCISHLKVRTKIDAPLSGQSPTYFKNHKGVVQSTHWLAPLAKGAGACQVGDEYVRQLSISIAGVRQTL